MFPGLCVLKKAQKVSQITEFLKLQKQSGLSLDLLAESLGYSTRTLRRYENGIATPRPPVIEAMRRLISRNETPKHNDFRFIDLFAGIGGLRRGFDGLGGKCVFTCEWNPYAQLTYAANFHDSDDHVFHGDITGECQESDEPRQGQDVHRYPPHTERRAWLQRPLEGDYKDGSEILIRQKGKNPRRLTPRECARLMGFDKPGPSEFKIPVSDMQAYKQFGNAVVVAAVEAVARHMAPWIEGSNGVLPSDQRLLAFHG